MDGFYIKRCNPSFLVGDVFDFWFDYKRVVPRGYIRILGKIAELKDKGIDIRFLPAIMTFG